VLLNTQTQVPRRRRGRPLALFLSALTLTAATACEDPFGAKASTEVKVDSLVVYAMTGTPLGFPSALNTVFRSIVRVDPSFNFQVAFDIDDQGRVRIIPVRLVGGTATASRTVGLQKATTTFDELEVAPTSGYQYDSVLVASKGDVVIVQTLTPEMCALFVNQNMYSKIVIDTVFVAERAIHFRLAHDPNCGFRSLAPGLPKI
jgi:hypothetical protein